jgi:N-methylhydantoinase B
MIFETAGGGGHGSPLDRETGLVMADLANGKITEPAARDVYGIVRDASGRSLDADATERRRAELRRRRLGG